MNTIKFYPLNLEVSYFAPVPIPSINLLPDWFKEMASYENNDKHAFRGINNEENGGGHFQNTTAKKCMSIFDTITSGYYLLSPVDIFFDSTGEKVVYKWRNNSLNFIMTHHEGQLGSYPRDKDYLDVALRWIPSHMIETPPGYSILVTHPHHQNDLPFYTLPGIIDTDNMLAAGALPFDLKKGYKGIIKRGTPIAQIMPFKREEWTHEVLDYQPDRFKKEANTVNAAFANVYKDNYWERKRFN